jgi:hypothetical protein
VTVAKGTIGHTFGLTPSGRGGITQPRAMIPTRTRDAGGDAPLGMLDDVTDTIRL